MEAIGLVALQAFDCAAGKYMASKIGSGLSWLASKLTGRPDHAPACPPTKQEQDKLQQELADIDFQKKEMERVRQQNAELTTQQRIMQYRLEQQEQCLRRQQHEYGQRLEEVRRFPKPRFFTDHGYENTINIAITGCSGAGKSTLINTLRDLHPRDPGAAKTGVSETTMEAKPYPCPECPDVRLWDLPGAGTFNYAMHDYLKNMGLRYFDAVIVVYSGRFTEIDAMLIKELTLFRIPFFAVRTKIDRDIENYMYDYDLSDYDLSARDTVTKIWEETLKQGVQNPYLISCAGKMQLMLPRLVEDIGKEIEKRRKVQMPVPSSVPGGLPGFESRPQTPRAPSRGRAQYVQDQPGMQQVQQTQPLSHEYLSAHDSFASKAPRRQGTAQGGGLHSFFHFPGCDARNRESSCASLRSMSEGRLSVAEEGQVQSPRGGRPLPRYSALNFGGAPAAVF
jgi:GTP-binding protein EngB required for normal cell division